ncbi:MAG: prepilin peptidase, partial [Terriglobales bacterium]
MFPVSFYAYPAFIVIVAVAAGLIVGSFLNVVIHRLPKMLERQWRAECAELTGTPSPPAERYDLVQPRSACPKCGHMIPALENIPLASYIALGGKCSQCRAPISLRY